MTVSKMGRIHKLRLDISRCVTRYQEQLDAGEPCYSDLVALRNMARDQLVELDKLQDIISGTTVPVKEMSMLQQVEDIQAYRRTILWVYKEACDLLYSMV